jgi:hypothetical protein
MPPQPQKLPQTALRSDADSASQAAIGLWPADHSLLRVSLEPPATAADVAPARCVEVLPPASSPFSPTATVVRLPAEFAAERRSIEAGRNDLLRRPSAPDRSAGTAATAVLPGASPPLPAQRPGHLGGLADSRPGGTSQQRTVRHHRRKAHYEERNAYQRPPAGGKPHCHR